MINQKFQLRTLVRIQHRSWERCIFFPRNLAQRGCCIRSPLATKLLHTVLFHEDITQLEQKNSSPWYTCDRSLHRVSVISVHYFWRYEHFTERHFHFSWSDFVACSRNLWTTQIPCNNYNYSEYRVHGTQNNRLELSVSMQKSILKNIHWVLRYWQKCIWVVQRFMLQATKSEHTKWKWGSVKCSYLQK